MIVFKEQKLNLVGKIVFASIGAWLIGRPVNLKLRGTPQEIEVTRNAMLASKAFQEELSRPNATVESVMQLLGAKHAASRAFEKTMDVPWPL